MFASISQLRTQTVVVTPDDLRKLDNSLRIFGGVQSYEVECADKITRRFSTLQELLDFENPPHKDIRLLRMKTSAPRNKTNAVISFENTTLTPASSPRTPGTQPQRSNIWISIEGDEARVVDLLHDLEDRLVAMKPRYSFMSHLDPLVTATVVFLVVGLPQLLIIAGAANREKVTIGDSKFWGLVLIFIPPFVLGFLLWYARIKLYPIAAFRIGQGEKRFTDKDFVSTVVIFGFVVSLASSLVAALILSLSVLGR
jgi:hypothetical protein